MLTKAELRKWVREQKKAARREELTRQSAMVCEKVMSLTPWREARTVLLYHPLPDEVDTLRLIDAALRESKVVLLPVVTGDEMELRCYEGDLQEGPFHILEPSLSSPPFYRYEEIDVAIVPGMGFDGQGHRLGRGKGYYDKFLSRCGTLYKVGVCFSFQMFERIPHESHDILMDEVVFGLSE